MADGHATTPPRLPGARRLGLAVAAVVIVADQLTKQLVEQVLERGEFVAWLSPHIGWQLVYNPHGAFGLPAPTWLFFLVTVVVAVVVLRTLPSSPTRLTAVAYGLLLAGALGNALDRAFRRSVTGMNEGWFAGDVVDFVAWGSFPRFNVADSAITVGLVLLLLVLLLEERRHRRQVAAADHDAEQVGEEGDAGEDPADVQDTGEDPADVQDATDADDASSEAGPAEVEAADADEGGTSTSP